MFMNQIQFVLVIKHLNANETHVKNLVELICPGDYHCKHFANLKRKDILGICDEQIFYKLFKHGLPSSLERFIDYVSIIDTNNNRNV